MQEQDERGYPPDPAPTPVQVVEYATPREVNADARRSILFGALLIVPFVTGFLAMRSARRGAKIAEATGIGRRTSLLGFMLGVANFMIWAVIIASLPMAVMRARDAAETVQCLSQLRQLSVGIFMYASSNGGWTPPSLNAAMPGATPFACPALKGGPSNYVYIGKGIRMNLVPRPSDYVTIYEPLTNHARGANFAFLDGHVEMVPPARAQKMINDLNSGLNPPP
jgi:prepilin-type processing-associated H-X9-DG protein